MSMFPHRRDLKFVGVERGGGREGEGSQKAKHFMEMYEARGVGVRKNPLHGGGVDNSWNYTIKHLLHYSSYYNSKDYYQAERKNKY